MERKQKIIDWRNRGVTFAEIGRRLNISRQRVQQIITKKKKKPRILKYQGESSHIKDMEGRERNRELVRIRDNWTCQDCGFRKTYQEVQEYNSKIIGLEGRTKGLDIHHTKGLCGKKSTGYDKVEELDYLITLCHKCHYNRPEHTTKKKTLTKKK